MKETPPICPSCDGYAFYRWEVERGFWFKVIHCQECGEFLDGETEAKIDELRRKYHAS